MKEDKKELIRKVYDLRLSRPGIGRRRVSKELGITVDKARAAIDWLMCHDVSELDASIASPAKKETCDWNALGDTASLVSIDKRIRTVNEAVEKAEVDLAEWEISHSQVTSWEVTIKDNDGKPITVPMWRVHVRFKRRPINYDRLRKEIIESMQKHAPQYPTYPKPKNTIKSVKTMVELAIMDLHYGKRSWEPETGVDFDNDIAERYFMAAIEDLLSKTMFFAPEKILLPLGNDMLHIDNMEGTTAHGTRQDVDDRQSMLFAKVYEMIVKGVDRLMEVAPVDIVVVPGNHDTVSMFHMGTTVQAHYRNTKRVHVDSSPRMRKYHRYGVNLLGFTHGGMQDAKIDSLPLIMATESDDWGLTTHHEWHTGHFHKRKETRYIAGDTHTGVVVRILPSMTGTDAWHYQKGFVKNERVSEAYVWSKENGYVGHFSTRPMI